MRIIWKILSLAGLALTIAPAFLVFAGRMEWSMHANLMILGAVLWFATAPFWMEGARD